MSVALRLGSCGRTLRLRAARLGWWRRSPSPTPVRVAWQRASPVERTTALALLLLGATYLAAWIAGSWGWLTDPYLQQDDVQANLFVFHRYDAEGALRNDESAQEMLAMIPPAVRVLHRALVPALGVPASAKAVQALCLLLVLAAGWLTARRRGGLATAVLLVVLAFHHWHAVGRIAGGLPRAFALPLLLLFGTGFIDRDERRRALATLAGALAYPPAAALMLAGEGIGAAVAAAERGVRACRRRLARLAVLGATCAFLTLVAFGPPPGVGPVLDASDMAATGAFGPSGRVQDPPFPDALRFVALHLGVVFQPGPSADTDAPLVAWHRTQGSTLALLAWTLLALLVFARVAPAPRAGTFVLAAGAVLYGPATWLAFRLYVPARYLAYATDAGSILAAAAVVGLVLPAAAPAARRLVRHGAAALLVGALLVLSGTAAQIRERIPVDAHPLIPLIAALKSLPVASRVAAHPMDGDIPPFWAGRASVTSLEATQPWHVAAWKREIERAQDTLAALYATDREKVLAHAEKYHVSHWLIDRERLSAEGLAVAGDFDEPLGGFAARATAGVDPTQLVLAHVPAEAIAWQDARHVIVDVARLRRAWTL